MPEYQNPHQVKANTLNARSSTQFDAGTKARETADKYVRDTVLFAAIRFLVALGQRFKTHAARLGVNAIAAAVLVYSLASIIELPRL